MKPGIYQVRVAALDLKGGSRGSANEWVTIPDLQSKQLSMSSLILGEKTAERESADSNPSKAEAPAAMGQVSVNLDHRFARTSYLRFVTYIYNATTASGVDPGVSTVNTGALKTSAPDLAVQVQIFRDNEPVITTPLHTLPTEGLDVRRLPYSADVSLADLQPGTYLLQLTVIDRRGKSSASQKTNFQIY